MIELPDDELPKLTVNLRLRDPEWEPIFVKGEQWATNRDSYYKDYDVEVEVVQLNLNTGGMRIRFPWPCKDSKKGFRMDSMDIGIEHFYKKYAIVERKQ